MLTVTWRGSAYLRLKFLLPIILPSAKILTLYVPSTMDCAMFQ